MYVMLIMTGLKARSQLQEWGVSAPLGLLSDHSWPAEQDPTAFLSSSFFFFFLLFVLKEKPFTWSQHRGFSPLKQFILSPGSQNTSIEDG